MPIRATTSDGDRFKEVSLAYEVLKDPERRARYDRYGAEGVFGPGAGLVPPAIPFGGGLGDLFDAFFNGMGGPGARGRGRSDRSDARSGCRDRAAAHLQRGGLRGAPPGGGDHAGALRHLRGERGPTGHLGRALPRVPGGGGAAAGAPVDPRPGDHRSALPALPGHRSVHRDVPVPTVAAKGGETSAVP